MGELLYADAIHIVEQSKIKAARITQASGNERRGSDTALAQFSASLGTSRQLDAAGSQVNDSAGNAARLASKTTTGILSSRIAAAEELGQAAAMAGAAGVGGASVEAHNTTVRLFTAIKEKDAERTLTAQQWASGKQRGNAIKAAVANIDNNAYHANLDYTQYVNHKKPSTFEQVVGLGLTAAATVYGGPQAGAAVMGVFESRQAARNADFANASASFTGAVKNGMSAVNTYQKTHGEADAAPAATEASFSSSNRFNFNLDPGLSSVGLK